MTLLHPIWLFLIIPLGVSLWLWRMPSRLLLVLRVLALLLVLLALSGLAARLPDRAGTIVVVADRSRSMPAASDVSQKEVIKLIHDKMGREDRLGVVAFGERSAVEHPPQTGTFAGFVHEVGPDGSKLDEALETALALIPKDSPGKVLVLSDGLATGRDPQRVAARAAGRGIAVDYRPVQRPTANDLAIAKVDAPAALAPGESFMITAWVQAPAGQEVSFALQRGSHRLAAGKQQLAPGLNRLIFRDQASEPGTQSYSLTVTGSGDDPVPENNRAHFLVGVQGQRPLLHVCVSPGSGLAALLIKGGLEVKSVAPDACDWSLEGLSKYAGVLLENVPADKIGTTGMETLAAWVRETGAGLMMTGGKSSYGQGGYYKSPLESILPVSMELRNEHRKLALAIVVALDRSGSMAVPVGGGRTKMDLANLGTAEVLQLLGPMDEFGVIAIDSEAHTVAKLAQVENKPKVRNDILRIESMGGGIYVYVALDAAARMILPAKAGTRHIILFSDAADAEEPGKYQDLLDKCAKAQITVSVIGLGTPADKDAGLLRDIARRGRGRIFFTDKPEELPRLFAQDTFVVARNAFLSDPTPIQTTAGLAALTGKQYEESPAIGGYNLCYLRPNANLAAVTVDEYKAPVAAAWQAGLGRVLCYTGEADGEFTGAIAQWKDAGDFFTSLARWTTGQSGQLPKNMLLTQEVQNGVNVVQLHLDPERKTEAFAGLPRVTVLQGEMGKAPEARKTAMRWSGADTLEVAVPLFGNETALTAVEVPGQEPIALPPVCLPYSPEFKPMDSAKGLQTLERLARATGGKERVNLGEIWKELPAAPRLVRIGPWLLLSAMLVLLLEVLERRTGLISRLCGWFWRFGRVSVIPAASVARTSLSVKPETDQTDRPTGTEVKEAEKPPPAAEEKSALVEALRQARRQTRGRGEP